MVGASGPTASGLDGSNRVLHSRFRVLQVSILAALRMLSHRHPLEESPHPSPSPTPPASTAPEAPAGTAMLCRSSYRAGPLPAPCDTPSSRGSAGSGPRLAR